MKKSRKKILVIDDEPDIVHMLEVRLKANGYDVAVATNGKDALHKAKNESPDLIILDIMMPELSGGEVARRLKGDPQTKDIPIVFLSAALSRLDKKEIDIDGCLYDAVSKPFHQPKLLSVIRKSLRASNRKPENTNLEDGDSKVAS